MAKPKLEGRIRYVKDWHGEGEHFIFENKWTNEGENEWGLESAFPLYGDEHELIHYTALTKIREWKKLGIDFYFC